MSSQEIRTQQLAVAEKFDIDLSEPIHIETVSTLSDLALKNSMAFVQDFNGSYAARAVIPSESPKLAKPAKRLKAHPEILGTLTSAERTRIESNMTVFVLDKETNAQCEAINKFSYRRYFWDRVADPFQADEVTPAETFTVSSLIGLKEYFITLTDALKLAGRKDLLITGSGLGTSNKRNRHFHNDIPLSAVAEVADIVRAKEHIPFLANTTKEGDPTHKDDPVTREYVDSLFLNLADDIAKTITD